MDAQYRILLVPIQNLLDSEDDPGMRLRQIAALQKELTELLADEHRRAREQLQAAGRFGPELTKLSSFISLGTWGIGADRPDVPPPSGPRKARSVEDLAAPKDPA